MCGIVGAMERGRSAESWRDVITPMRDRMTHRGPDDAGIWCDPEAGVGFGHRRLSILDLSSAGHQPMASASGRWMITFNGEIYNFAELRDALLAMGWSFRGHSDTEILLAGFEAWGVVEALRRSTGMFALAVWDRSDRTLWLARDRMGEKPLYYGRQGRALLFGSELKALRAHPAWEGTIDQGALGSFLRLGYVSGPGSIFVGIERLPPGSVLRVDSLEGPLPDPIPFWSADERALRGAEDPFVGSPEEAVDEVESLLKVAIGRQMVADVPVGAFLSGGIDSSLVVALAQEMSDRAVRTFTIGFHDADYNEAHFAAEVAGHLGTDHTELIVTPQETLDAIPRLPAIWDEPFADPSQIPTLLVAELARRDVTVSLSGDGGDELFGGYKRYRATSQLWQRMSRVPRGVRRLAGATIEALPSFLLDGLFGPLSGALNRHGRPGRPGDKVKKAAALLGSTDIRDLYQALVSHWPDPASLLTSGAEETRTPLADPERAAGLGRGLAALSFLDAVSYLPDDILVKLDRASMAVSLESRAPMLDHALVEFAWTLPESVKVRDGASKWPLRALLYRKVPRGMVDRPKAGFGIPVGTWLGGPLRDWAEELLAEDRLEREGLFRPEPIRKAWSEHLSGARNWQYRLWDVLMFQAWKESWDRGPVAPVGAPAEPVVRTTVGP